MNEQELKGFAPLTINEKKLHDQFAAKTPGLISSACHFSTLLAWKEDTRVLYKIIGDYLCFLCRDRNEKYWYGLPPLGPYDQDHEEQFRCTVEDVYEVLESQNDAVRFQHVNDWMLPYFAHIDRFLVDIFYERNKSDYIYRINDFADSLHMKEAVYNIRHLQKNHEPEVRIFSEQTRADCVKVLEEVWCKNHSCEECSEGCQKKALEQFFNCRKELGLFGFVVYSKKHPIGYCGVVPVHEAVIFQIKKNVHGIRGLTEFMHEEAWKRYCLGYEWINYTEDMGRLGLRYHKQHLAPYVLLHDYILHIRAR